ncbi:hypothetical protein QQ054_03465 [Oscillatoria amoena NRMC-F 0135]|nr:hypothetical protein [Oscillatoria amoena NRMC-F 0135]
MRTYIFPVTVWLSLLVYGCQKGTTPVIIDPVAESQKYAPPDKTPKPQGTPLELGLAGSAKVFCSAIYVSNRKPEEAIVHSVTMFLPEDARTQVKYVINPEKKIRFHDLQRHPVTLCDILW